MKRLKITEEHYGYPSGKRKEKYLAGAVFNVPSEKMPLDYAELIVAKGHAEYTNDQPAEAGSFAGPDELKIGE